MYLHNSQAEFACPLSTLAMMTNWGAVTSSDATCSSRRNSWSTPLRIAIRTWLSSGARLLFNSLVFVSAISAFTGANIVATATIVKAAAGAARPGRSGGGWFPAHQEFGHCGGLHAAH